jgi:hypothetical protein
MSFRHWIRIVAAILMGLGFLCLPNPGGSPKRLTSLFFFFADIGSFFHLGLALAGSGIVLLLLTFIGSRE